MKIIFTKLVMFIKYTVISSLIVHYYKMNKYENLFNQMKNCVQLKKLNS